MARTNTNSGGGGGGTISGTLQATQVGYGSALNVITSDADFTRGLDPQKQTTILSYTYAQALFQDNGGNQAVVQADTVGDAGNGPSLVANGTDTIDDIVAAWNVANPGNTVSVVSGSGLVPTAGTYNVVGGGQTGFEAGTIQTPFGPLQGMANAIVDQVDNLYSFNIVGNIGAVTGTSGVGNLGVAIDGNNGHLSFIINQTEGLQIGNTDQSTYNSQIGLDSSAAQMTHKGKGFSARNNFLGWFNNANSNTYNLPYSSLPSVGQALVATGVTGNDVQLDWGSGGGGGSPAGVDTNVQFNDGGTFGGSNDFVWQNTLKNFFVGDLTSGNPTPAKLQIGGLGGTFYGYANKTNFYGYEQYTNSPYTWLVQESGNGVITLGTQSANNHVGIILHNNDAYVNTILGTGSRKNVLNEFFASGSIPGPNSNLGEATMLESYNGNNNFSNFTATITNLDTQRVDVTPGYTGPFPIVGDTITGSTGAIGTVYQSDGTQTLYIENITGGTYNSGDSISGTYGFTGTVQSTDYIVLVDRFTFDNPGNGTIPNLPTLLNPYLNIQGTNFAFQNYTGHGIGDVWNATFTVQFGNLFSFNGQYGQYVIGDPSAVSSNANYIYLNDKNQSLNNYVLNEVNEVTNSFAVRNPANSTQSYLSAIWNSGNPTITLSGPYGYNTQLKLDDFNRQFTFNVDGEWRVSNTANSRVLFTDTTTKLV